MEHAKHIIRVVLLLVLVMVLFVVVRHFAIPESFGVYGHYRFDNVAEHAVLTPVHGAPGACGACHDEQTEAMEAGRHSDVSCEVCHAPLGTHVQGDEVIGEMPARRSYRLCGWCHQRLEARPQGFPQVVLVDHVTEQGAEMSEGVCWECHEDAHNPTGE